MRRLFPAGQNPEWVLQDISADGLLQSGGFFRSCGVVSRRSWRKARRHARLAELREPCASDQARVGRWGAREGQESAAPRRHWDTGIRQRNGQCLLCSREKVTTPQKHASRVAYARLRMQTLCRSRDTSFELLCEIQFCQSVGMSVLAYTVPPCLGSSDTSLRRRSSINRTKYALSTRHTESAVAVQRGNTLEPNNTSVRPMTATDWSNKIFSPFSLVGESDRAERVGRGCHRLGRGRARSSGARCGSLRFGANGRVTVCSGFRVMSIRRRPFDRHALMTHHVLQLHSCHALSR